MELVITFSTRWHRVYDLMKERFEPNIRSHMANVYMGLLMILASIFLGVQLQYQSIMNLGSLAICFTPLILVTLHYHFSDNPTRVNTLFCGLLLVALGICLGQAMANTFERIYGLTSKKNILCHAILGTVATFIYLTLAAIMAAARSCMNLNRCLLLFAHSTWLLSVLSIVYSSFRVEMLKLYGTVLIMIVFVLCDTQYIVTAHRGGSRNVLHRSLDLCIDIIIMFRSLLYIVAQKELHRELSSYNQTGISTI